MDAQPILASLFAAIRNVTKTFPEDQRIQLELQILLLEKQQKEHDELMLYIRRYGELPYFSDAAILIPVIPIVPPVDGQKISEIMEKVLALRHKLLDSPHSMTCSTVPAALTVPIADEAKATLSKLNEDTTLGVAVQWKICVNPNDVKGTHEEATTITPVSQAIEIVRGEPDGIADLTAVVRCQGGPRSSILPAILERDEPTAQYRNDEPSVIPPVAVSADVVHALCIDTEKTIKVAEYQRKDVDGTSAFKAIVQRRVKPRHSNLYVILEQGESIDDIHPPAILPWYSFRDRTFDLINDAVHPTNPVAVNVNVPVGNLINLYDVDLWLDDEKNPAAYIDNCVISCDKGSSTMLAFIPLKHVSFIEKMPMTPESDSMENMNVFLLAYARYLVKNIPDTTIVGQHHSSRVSERLPSSVKPNLSAPPHSYFVRAVRSNPIASSLKASVTSWDPGGLIDILYSFVIL